jgi:hypothetical protein
LEKEGRAERIGNYTGYDLIERAHFRLVRSPERRAKKTMKS